MIDFLLNMIGIYILFELIDYKRPEEYKFKTFTKDWWKMIGLLMLALILIENF